MKRRLYAYLILILVIALSAQLDSGFAFHLQMFIALLLSRFVLEPVADPIVSSRFASPAAWKISIFRFIVEYCAFSTLFITLCQVYFAFVEIETIRFFHLYIFSFSGLLLSIILAFKNNASFFHIIFAVFLYVIMHNLIAHSWVFYHITAKHISLAMLAAAIAMILAAYISFMKWDGVINED